MKYLSLLPLAGMAIAAPGTWVDSDPAKKTTTTTPAATTATWADVPGDVTVTSTATGTYCPGTGKLTKPAPEGGKCTIDVTTVTVAKTTVTVTADGGNGGHGGAGGAGGKVTVTETTTKTVGGKDTVTETTTKTVGGKETVTVTKTESGSGPTDTPDHGGNGGNGGNGGKCLTDDKAKSIVDNFRNLLEFTSYNGTRGAPGRGYNYNISKITLAEDFVDISDSINYMAGFPLGSITFANKTAFDYGQGVLQPEVKTETLNIFHDCSSITWRWKITPPTQVSYPVVGINYMQINKDGLIQKQFAEFDNAAWIESFPPGTGCNSPTTGKPPTVVSGAFAAKN